MTILTTIVALLPVIAVFVLLVALGKTSRYVVVVMVAEGLAG